jgi:hypothetical protein
MKKAIWQLRSVYSQQDDPFKMNRYMLSVCKMYFENILNLLEVFIFGYKDYFSIFEIYFSKFDVSQNKLTKNNDTLSTDKFKIYK